MSEQELHRVQLRSVRTAPPGNQIPTCQGTFCSVTTKRLLVPGATYGSEIPLQEIVQCDALDAFHWEGCEFAVSIDTPHLHMFLCCSSKEESERLVKAIRIAAGFRQP